MDADRGQGIVRPGTCRYQREKSATISFAAPASSGLAIFRVAFTKNSCST